MMEAASLAIGMVLFIIFLVLAFFALVILGFVLWIMMIIDCAKRKFKEESERIVWILILIFLGIVGAIIYYFVVKKAK